MKTGMKRGNLFLLELICNLFIFVLCAGVCVGLLLHAKSLSKQSTELTDAVYAAQSAAAEWQSGTFREGIWYSVDGETQAFALDQAGQPLPAGQEGYYTLTLKELPEENGVTYAEISVLQGDREIFAITAGSAGEVYR